MKNIHDYCIIMAGGQGRRLWPTSRKDMPKQFIDFFGTGRTLLQQTYDRMARIFPHENIIVSTYEGYHDIVRRQLPEVDEANILLEPVQLSTAPAVMWASAFVAARDGEARVLVTPTDHHIVNTDAFEKHVRCGLDFVGAHDEFLALGVKATVPHTAYGYIQTEQAELSDGMYRVKTFTEKPAADYARLFVESGEFLWNTGMFLWNVRTMYRLIGRITPAVAHQMESNAGMIGRQEQLSIIRELYPANMSRSVDLVILNDSAQVCVQECNFGWADVGCWPELHRVLPKDVDGNAVVEGARAMFSACANNIVSLPEGGVAVIKGLDGYIVSQRDNLLVICPKDDPMAVRRMADEAAMQLGPDLL